MLWKALCFVGAVLFSFLDLVVASGARPERATDVESDLRNTQVQHGYQHQHDRKKYKLEHEHVRQYRLINEQQRHHRNSHRHQHGEHHRSLTRTLARHRALRKRRTSPYQHRVGLRQRKSDSKAKQHAHNHNPRHGGGLEASVEGSDWHRTGSSLAEYGEMAMTSQHEGSNHWRRDNQHGTQQQQRQQQESEQEQKHEQQRQRKRHRQDERQKLRHRQNLLHAASGSQHRQLSGDSSATVHGQVAHSMRQASARNAKHRQHLLHKLKSYKKKHQHDTNKAATGGHGQKHVSDSLSESSHAETPSRNQESKEELQRLHGMQQQHQYQHQHRQGKVQRDLYRHKHGIYEADNDRKQKLASDARATNAAAHSSHRASREQLRHSQRRQSDQHEEYQDRKQQSEVQQSQHDVGTEDRRNHDQDNAPKAGPDEVSGPEPTNGKHPNNGSPGSGSTQPREEEIEPVPKDSHPQCAAENYLRKQVVPDLISRKQFFLDGQPQTPTSFAGICTLPRHCQEWASRASCCTSEFFEGVQRREQEQTAAFEMVKAQYEGLRLGILEPAKMAAKKRDLKGVDALLHSSNFSKVLHVSRSVTNFTDHCEDRIRLHFASMLCQLCDSKLESMTREGKLMLATSSCENLAIGCQRMPEELHKAGTEYGRFLELLKHRIKKEDASEIPPAVHRLRDWLHRASILLRLLSKRISFYDSGATSMPNSEFCQKLGSQGHTYNPSVWGYVAMLHLSNLAPAEPEEMLSPDVLTLQLEAEKLGYVPDEQKEARKTHHKLQGNKTHHKLKGNKTHHKLKDKTRRPEMGVEKAEENGKTKLAKARVTTKETPRQIKVKKEMACKKCGPHGQPAGTVCVCDPCWGGECCDQEAAPGPYVNQPFQPLMAQNVLGSVQTLTVGGCQLSYGSADYQFARIKLHPKKDEVDDSDVCKLRLTGDAPFRTLMEHVPVSVQESHYAYLIDIPIGYAGAYEVCYCFGLECQHRTDMWNRIGTVHIAETAEEQADMIKGMRSPEKLLSLVDLEAQQHCRTDWQLGYDYNIEFDNSSADMVRFRCKEGFEHLEGVHEMLCHLGKWRVLSTNNYVRQVREVHISVIELSRREENPANGSATPLDAFHMSHVVPDPVYLELFNGQFPSCRKKGGHTCPEPGLNGLSKLGESKDSHVVVTADTLDGMAWHSCKVRDWHQLSVVMLIRGLGIGKYVEQGSPVLVPPNSIGQVSKKPDEGSDEFEITLVPTLQHRDPKRLLKKLDAFELIMMQTPFKQACDNGSWLPQNVLIRCAEASDFDWGLTALDVQEAENELGLIAAQQKQKEQRQQAMPAASSGLQLYGQHGAGSLRYQEPSSILELGSSSSSMQNSTFKSGKDAQNPQLKPTHWPIAFSNDGHGAFHVQSCWTSHFNCSDGSVALDTSTGLHLNEAPSQILREPFIGRHSVWKRFLAQILVAMILLMLVWLMVQSFKSTDKSQS